MEIRSRLAGMIRSRASNLSLGSEAGICCAETNSVDRIWMPIVCACRPCYASLRSISSEAAAVQAAADPDL